MERKEEITITIPINLEEAKKHSKIAGLLDKDIDNLLHDLRSQIFKKLVEIIDTK